MNAKKIQRRVAKWFKVREERRRFAALGLALNREHLIRLPSAFKADCIAAYWRWLNILSQHNYARALESLYWPDRVEYTPDSFKEQMTTFFGGDKPWFVVIPNERLVEKINGALEFDADVREGGWFRALIPLTNETRDPKDDEILLVGLGASFFVRALDGLYVMEFEIFHA